MVTKAAQEIKYTLSQGTRGDKFKEFKQGWQSIELFMLGLMIITKIAFNSCPLTNHTPTKNLSLKERYKIQ